MNKRDKSTNVLKLISTAGFFLYGMFCMVTQTAYLPATSHDDYLYTRMEGAHAIALGVSLILLAVCSGVPGRLWDTGGKDQVAWIIRGIGIGIAFALGWYALSVGTGVN